MPVFLACRYQGSSKPEGASGVCAKHREKDLGFVQLDFII